MNKTFYNYKNYNTIMYVRLLYCFNKIENLTALLEKQDWVTGPSIGKSCNLYIYIYVTA